MAAELDRDPFTLHELELMEWPRRLLYVLEMRSYERDGDNTYGGVREPAYNIISYTWGRWELPTRTEQSISIQGIDWETPAVSPHIFTVAEFQSVLQHVGNDVDWVWVDIACIDQKNVTVRDEEVGRQAGIFNKANEALSGCITHLCRSFSMSLTCFSRLQIRPLKFKSI
jgi:hypothetical protein